MRHSEALSWVWRFEKNVVAMDMQVLSHDPLTYETPLLAMALWQGDALPEALASLIEAEDWTGSARKTMLLYPRGAAAARRVLLVGLGKREDASADRLRDVAGMVARTARDMKVGRYALALPELPAELANSGVQAASEGAALGLYRYLKYKSDHKPEEETPLTSVALLVQSAGAEDAARRGQAVALGVALARDLANAPGNDVVPARLGDVAEELGQQYGFSVTVFDLARLKAEGFGGIIGVGQGSANEPRFIVMEYGQKQEGQPTICFVGKGITFDTGGISIKPAERMDDMKMDMGGAAAVFGAMKAIGELKPSIHVVGLVASAENMPSSTAYKPGDVLTTLSGKTIEVLNTDAEGRIVLADALHYAQRYEPDAIIDLATLTGAIGIALGPHAIGLFSNNDDLSQRLAHAGDATEERVWRLPLWQPYRDQIKSDIADIKNTGGRPGGSITAAAFLEHFVGSYPWAHLDIASTAWVDRQTKGYTAKGATGVGVRLLIATLESWLGDASASPHA